MKRLSAAAAAGLRLHGLAAGGARFDPPFGAPVNLMFIPARRKGEVLGAPLFPWRFIGLEKFSENKIFIKSL
jgi:hypothetical protein